MKLYEQLLEITYQTGVREILWVPGDAINPLIEALRVQNRIHPQAVAGKCRRHLRHWSRYRVGSSPPAPPAGQRFLLSFNLATIAFAMPAALGVQLA